MDALAYSPAFSRLDWPQCRAIPRQPNTRQAQRTVWPSRLFLFWRRSLHLWVFSSTFVMRCVVAVKVKAAALLENVSNWAYSQYFGTSLTARYCVMPPFLQVQRGLSSRPKPIARRSKNLRWGHRRAYRYAGFCHHTRYNKKRDLFTGVSIRSRPHTTRR